MAVYFTTKKTAEEIWILVFNRTDKEVNILSESVVKELSEHLLSIKSSSAKGLVVISGKKDFALGADIEDITGFKSPEETAGAAAKLQAVYQGFKALGIPTVCAIHGQCLGGGLELALSCDYRVASDDKGTKLGLPEIQLGLIPGAGGTQKLPRLIGLRPALDLILTGKSISSRKAKKLGLVDAVCPISLLEEEAILWAKSQRKRKPQQKSTLSPKRLSQIIPKWVTEENLLGRKFIRKKAQEMIVKNTKGFYPAPIEALNAIFEGFERKLEDGLAIEAASFGKLAHTKESFGLVHLFHATTHAKKNPYRELIKGEPKTRVIGIYGAGFMGAGIATVAADKGIRALLSDPNTDSLSKAIGNARDFFFKRVKKKRLKGFEARSKLAHVVPGLSPSGFQEAEIVIEAVFEDLKLKQKILLEFEKKSKDHQIFATNTSAIPVKDLQAGAQYPDRIVGLHFFSPVEKMPLLEIVKGPQTSDLSLAKSFEFARQLGKQMIIVNDGPGFYTTRVLAFFLSEAAQLLVEGAEIDLIDKALMKFGFPVGPVTLMDEVGFDVGIHVLGTMGKHYGERIPLGLPLDGLQTTGRLGRKNGRGFYLYEDGKKGIPDLSIYELIDQQRPSGLKKRTNIKVEEIIDRCVLSFVNESIRCLEDGILNHPYDGDIGAVFGLGFPPFHGGPFKYVDLCGAKSIKDRLEALEQQFGVRFSPTKTLNKQAETGSKFFPAEKN